MSFHGARNRVRLMRPLPYQPSLADHKHLLLQQVRPFTTIGPSPCGHFHTSPATGIRWRSGRGVLLTAYPAVPRPTARPAASAAPPAAGGCGCTKAGLAAAWMPLVEDIASGADRRTTHADLSSSHFSRNTPPGPPPLSPLNYAPFSSVPLPCVEGCHSGLNKSMSSRS
jgi:hypothetical protein